MLLNYFVKCFEYIYGTHFISHNVHGLLHIVDDYRNFGALDSCSCFPFENYMQILKSSLRKHDKPLQQFVRRYQEKCSNKTTTVINANDSNYKNIHHLGPILDNVTCGPQLLNLKIKNSIIRLKSSADIFILTNKGEIVKVLNIAQLTATNTQVVIGFKFRNKEQFYKKPLKSSKVNIYIVHHISNNLEYWKIMDIQAKMMVLPFDNKFIAMSLIH